MKMSKQETEESGSDSSARTFDTVGLFRSATATTDPEAVKKETTR